MDYKEIWNKTDEDLKSSLPAHAYEAWIETLSPIGITNDIFIVEAPNQFAYDWIINNYQDIISSSLREVDEKLRLKVSIAPQSEQSVTSVELDSEETTKQSNAGKRNKINPSNIFLLLLRDQIMFLRKTLQTRWLVLPDLQTLTH